MIKRIYRAWLQYRLTDVESRLYTTELWVIGLERRLEEERAIVLKLRAERTRAKAKLFGCEVGQSELVTRRAA